MIKRLISIMLICTMITASLALLSSCDKPDAGQTTTSGTEGQDQTPELTDGRTMFFIATDIFGNVYYSDIATMKMKYTY